VSAETADPAAAAAPPDPALEASARRAGLSPSTARALATGAALHARGQFYEAHEAWEEAWLQETGQPRLLLQGLIHVTAAMHKATVQRMSNGCLRLLASALEKLQGLGEQSGGVDLAGVRQGIEHVQVRAVAWHEGRGEPPAASDAPAIRPAG
jgi:predicted metal-dependent hydrolase